MQVDEPKPKASHRPATLSESASWVSLSLSKSNRISFSQLVLAPDFGLCMSVEAVEIWLEGCAAVRSGLAFFPSTPAVPQGNTSVCPSPLPFQ